MKTVAARFCLGTSLLLSSIACAQAADPSPAAVFSATRDRLVADISRQQTLHLRAETHTEVLRAQLQQRESVRRSDRGAGTAQA